MPIATASQTIGPFWHLLETPGLHDLTRLGAAGEKIALSGRITDGDANPVSDACVEIWQATPPTDAHFLGFGRCATDPDGRYRFITIAPGPVPGRGNATQAPHIAITILARGILTRLVTRAYFTGQPLNDTDPLLNAIADPARRSTLLAIPATPSEWVLDIRLQGSRETVFFDI